MSEVTGIECLVVVTELSKKRETFKVTVVERDAARLPDGSTTVSILHKCRMGEVTGGRASVLSVLLETGDFLAR